MVGWVLDQHIPDPGMKLVLISLANAHNNRSAQCNPGLDVIGRESSLSRSTVLRKIKALADDGWITVASSFDESGRQTSNAYVICTARGEGVTMAPPKIDTPEGVTAMAPPRVSGATPTIEPEEEPEERTSPNPQGGNGRKDFQRLWESWPVDHLPDNLEYALKQFLKLSDVERAYAEEVVDVYRRRCAIRGAHPRMIPYLKEKQFLDLVDAPEMDKDGDFIVTPKHRLEWSEWLGSLRKGRDKVGADKAVAYHVQLGKIIVKTRWPDGFGRLPSVRE
jgi:hypothetical protein